ncbi:PREDICTED: endo-1,3;1,4-beta-D-glucanase-like [Tarenaya hassleriana]|uniref:endo-1,3;1,4-beta-D-glucanase-like n=1 Tax=Tarenaya hassleriana TaxID=28532 RepID=UPI00053C6FD6|nr:PREDICTED: endo-1,3;1,4-beta-D-glucanase-like [Tarenaya hassleriana]
MSGPQCCENPPTLDPNSGLGRVEKFGGLDTYITGSPNSNRGILLVSDIFGYQAPNLRKLADKVAAAGFYVVVPDFFYGDPYNGVEDYGPIAVWLKNHGPLKGFEDSKPVIEALKCKGITAIGAAGMCWGAKVVVELDKTELIQAGVFLHPSFVTVDDIKDVKVPLAILGAELDHVSPPALLKQFEEVLASKPEVKSYVKIFPGVSHGWSVRYDTNDPAAVKAAEESHKEMLDWFITYVK